MSEKMYKELEKILCYSFGKKKLLEEALTHASMRKGKQDNERMEFLGDRVLGVVIASWLYEEYEKAPPAELSIRYNSLVARKVCVEIAKSWNLDKYLHKTGPLSPTMLGNACEAIIGAIYLDGGIEKAKKFILYHWKNLLLDITHNAKSSLQEYLARRNKALPEYRIIEQSGPDHNPVFMIEVRLDSGESARAKAGTRKEAETKAAEALLKLLES
ncbi:MAG: ribonuclease III [Parvibaculales bacterium]